MNRAPTVVITADQLRHPVPGGIGVYVKGLLQGLGALGTHPTVVLSRGPALADALSMIGRERVMTSALPRRALSLAWDNGWPLPRPAREGVALVHATSLSTPGPGFQRNRLPLSVFIHDVSFLRFPEAYPARGLRWHRAALTRARQRANVVLVPSVTIRDQLVDIGFDAELISVTGEGADHLPLVARTNEGGYFLSVGTHQPRKNLRRLILSYARIRTRLPEMWPLKIVGPAGWGDVEMEPTEGVEWLGSVSDQSLAALYAEARVFAYVPLDEGFGLPVVEAQRAGVPVVASQATPSAAMNPNSCLLVSAQDVEQISDGLFRAATDDVWRNTTVAHATETVRTHSWSLCAEKHLEAWSKCVS